MYSFEPDEEQKMLVEALNRFAVNDLRTRASENDEERHLPPFLVEKGWELGLLQASIPEAYGGFGERSAVTGVLAAEELAYGDLAGALAVMTPGLFAVPLLLVGTEQQKQKYLPAIAEEQWAPYTAGIVEPYFDFDALDLRTTATEQGDQFVINGEKMFVPYAADAEAMLVYAQVGDQTQGFIVHRDTDGLVIGEREKTLGLYALPCYRVKLNGVRVLKSDRLGGETGHPFAPILDAMRVALSAMALGLSRAALEYARDYAKDREVFKVKVAQKQAIAFMIAEMATEIEAMRLVVWEAAWMLDRDMPEASKHAYLALCGAMDMAMMVTDRSVQVLGGHGYIREHPVERWMRNGRGIAMLNGLVIV